MRFSLLHVSLVLALFSGISMSAQSKKEVIAEQGSAMDSLVGVMDQQHELLLKAKERIEQDQDLIDAYEASLKRERARYDSLYTACGVAYTALSKEKDDLVNQRRASPGRLVRAGPDLQRYLCYTPFSISGLSDTLAVEFAGPDLLSSVITLRIIAWDGSEVYRAPVELLRPEELTDDEALQQCTMETRILTFFQDRRFSFPPIDAQRDVEHTDKIAAGISYAVDRSTWDDIRFDAYTSAFTFPISSSESRTIAFSRKLNKVVDLTPVHQ